MKENSNLRREMEDFLSAVDEARKHIDAELNESNARIQDLKTENSDLKRENENYKKQLNAHINMNQMNRHTEPNAKEKEYFIMTEVDIHDLRSRMNEQIFAFTNIARKQSSQQNSNSSVRRPSIEDKTSSNIATYEIPPKSSGYWPDAGSREKIKSAKSKIFSIALNSPQCDMTRTQPNSARKKHEFSLNLNDDANSLKKSHFKTRKSEHSSPSKTERATTNSLDDYDSIRKSPRSSTVKSSSFLKTKLKSDAILQSMRKKIIGEAPYSL